MYEGVGNKREGGNAGCRSQLGSLSMPMSYEELRETGRGWIWSILCIGGELLLYLRSDEVL